MPSTIRLENTSDRVSDQLVATPPELRLESELAETVISLGNEGRLAPISLSQERFWFLDQINPGDASSNLSRGIRINGDLNHGLLRRSLATIVHRHDSLRATFATSQLYAGRDSRPVQLIAAYRAVEMPLIDLSNESLNQREARARELARHAAQLTFDLTLGPLLRATLLRLSNREHVLLLNVHRIVCDEPSLQIIVDELWACYSAFARGTVARLASLQIQYADYAAWQQKLIEEDSFTAELDFWRGNLEGAPAVIELPTDWPKPAVRTWHGKSICQKLNNELLQQLRALADCEHLSLGTVLLAALKVVLGRHSGQHDLVVGSVISNRDQPAAKHLVGPLSNLLVFRTSLAGDPTFRQLLSRVQATTHQAHEHRLVPLETLLKELPLERSLSHTPLFQVTFNLERAQCSSGEAVGLKLEEFEFDADITSFDLTVDVFERPDHLSWQFRYSTDLFDHATIERLGGHVNSVLEAIAYDAEQRVSALPLLTQSERRQILEEWNETGAAYGKDCCLHEMFAEQAEKRAGEIAVVWGSEELSYGELNRRANQLAHYLKQRGVGPEVLVGVCVKRGWEMVVGILGILKAGGAYVPLDPGYPEERLRFMLEDAKARLLLTQERLLPQLPETAAEVVCLDRDWEEISKESEANAGAGVGPGNLAYVIYTSGSTGQPKGVAIDHRALTNFLLSVQQQPGLAADDVLLAVTTLSFDIAGLEIYLPLITGARVVIADAEVASDGIQLKQLIAESGATVMQATPATWQMLINAGWQGQAGLKVLCGGEALSRELANKLVAKGATVWNMYGPTETTVWSTIGLIDAGDEPISIGRPIANTQIYVLDEENQPVPVGIAGELHIGGNGVARGYLNRPELTAKVFLPDAFSREVGARLYKTGDLGRYLGDGRIEYLGRFDSQVKVRGYRIELGEIEAVLR
ncbi:MAG TPA: amino acid adenylation domain-containing protein, partial [Pyrinomonadaceae bacterium]